MSHTDGAGNTRSLFGKSEWDWIPGLGLDSDESNLGCAEDSDGDSDEDESDEEDGPFPDTQTVPS